MSNDIRKPEQLSFMMIVRALIQIVREIAHGHLKILREDPKVKKLFRMGLYTYLTMLSLMVGVVVFLEVKGIPRRPITGDLAIDLAIAFAVITFFGLFLLPLAYTAQKFERDHREKQENNHQERHN